LKQILVHDLPVDYDHFCNDWGSLRLCKVQHHYGYRNGEQFSSLSAENLSALVDIYTSWRDTDEIVPIKYVYQDYEMRDYGTSQEAARFVNAHYQMFGKQLKQYKFLVTVPKEVFEWSFPKAVKRGNDQYLKLVKERFDPILSQPPRTFFERDWGIKKTNMLYVTGTVDPSLCGNDRGWLSFGSWWNSFITNVRQQFGRMVYVRAWQSQENGFPHFHALLYFKDQEFTAVRWDKDNTFRLPSRAKYRTALKEAWKPGHLDIIAVDNTQDAFKDMLKYILRDLGGGESDLTNAMVWYFRRQSFSISKGFAEAVWGKGCITLAEPGNADLITANKSNSNLPLIRIEIYPTLRRDLFSNPMQTTLLTWEDPPPLTESDVQLLEHLTCDCVLVECKKSEKLMVPVFMYKKRS